ncbi:MAG: glutathione S-transferase family protein [Proteobacteria bacterium]|nr:glutathione S-transferase family protein [Pseudomonadota bacterium]
MMKLYFLPGAPSPNRVRLYIAEKNAESTVLDIQEVNLQGGLQRSAAHLLRNPFGKVPVLEVAQGTFISESLAIAEYLEECFPMPPLFGRTKLERARVRELERVAELRVFYPLGRYVQATVTQAESFPEPGVAAHFLSRIPAGLEFLDRELSTGKPYIAGDFPSMADCTLAAILEFARAKGVMAVAGYPALTEWFDRYRARPAVRTIFHPTIQG